MLAILQAHETIFFREIDGQLRQAITVRVAWHADSGCRSLARLTSGGETVVTPLDFVSGVNEYTVYAPTLWPERRPDLQARLSLVARDDRVETTLAVGSHRPWTVYILSDTCTDYTWNYSSEQAMIDDDAALLLAEMDMADASVDLASENRNRYNLVHAREVAYFLDRYPDQAERLWRHVRACNVTLNPFYNMAMTSAMSLEELVRQFYPARGWAREHGLEMGYANHQETPTITWGMASIMAQCGIGHLVKSVLPYECPWASRLREAPVYAWEGPDGQRILVRLRKTDYFEARYLNRGLEETNQAVHNETIPHYEGLGSAYPFDAIGAVGVYSDLSAKSVELARNKFETIQAYNAQGWDYPRLVNASHRQFWDHLEHTMASGGLTVPVVRGHYGTSWEAWPGCMAHDLAGWRRAQTRVVSADALMVMAHAVGAHPSPDAQARLAHGWQELLSLSDHAWNGANADNLELNAKLRRRWQLGANQAFDEVIAQGLETLAGSKVAANAWQVVNTRGWVRSGVVTLDGLAGPATVREARSGDVLPSQWDGDRQALMVSVRDVPALGTARLDLAKETASTLDSPWTTTATGLEGPYYRVSVDAETGRIVSLWDKVRDREMVDAESPYGLSEPLYWSDGVEHRASAAKVSIDASGAVMATMVISSQVAGIDVEMTVTLYAETDRIDFTNRVHKPVSTEKQELDFAFPLQVPDCRVLLGTPGVVIDTATELRPGAGLAYTVARHFVDMRNDDYGVLFTQRDGMLVEFGHRTTLEDPVTIGDENSTILAVALENIIDWNESAHDQLGVTDFTFRYALRGHDGSYDLALAATDAWDAQDDLLAMPGDQGQLPAEGLVRVEPEGVVLTHTKLGEEGGSILRLWAPGPDDVSATVDFSRWPHTAVIVCDPLERAGQPIQGVKGVYRVPVSGRGTTTLKVEA